ncbi:acyl carrier protein [Georgenia thermotolerans]|uniref:Acyl carrier protein n=1 Tax=Georgenia thermotolerans TaxID=527326 RepID=A0A7J5UR05_9MICO|nr:acyl carrier protein [Georgenia thermotolerans]KAE8764872.1 acyl carrier protein [Georgenia thermotolerans]
MNVSTTTLDGVVAAIVETLGIEERAHTLDASTPLFGSMPELDSLAVLSLAGAIEERFDIEIDDADFTGEVFETVGTLAQFVESRRA